MAWYKPSDSPHKYLVKLPPNITPGATFIFRLSDSWVRAIPAKEGEPGFKMTVWMQVPEGKRSHCNMLHLHEDGMQYSLKVPYKMVAGQHFQHTITLQERPASTKSLAELYKVWLDSDELVQMVEKYEDCKREIRSFVNNQQRSLSFTGVYRSLQEIANRYYQEHVKKSGMEALASASSHELGNSSSQLRDVEPMQSDPPVVNQCPSLGAAAEAAARGVAVEDNEAINTLADLAHAHAEA